MNKDKLIKRRMQEAEKFQRNGHNERALGLYEDVLRLDPEYEKAIFQRFDCLIATQPARAVLPDGDALVLAFPNSSMSWMCKGLVHFRVGDYETAEKAYRHSISLEPGNFASIHNLGFLLCHIGQEKEGTDLLIQSVEIQPDYQDGHATLLMAYYKQKRYADAICAGKKAPDIICQRPDLQYMLADSHYQCEDYARSRLLFSGFIQVLMDKFEDFIPHIPLVSEHDEYDHMGMYSGNDADYLIATYYRAAYTLITNKLKNKEEKAEIMSDLAFVLIRNPDHAYALAAMAEICKKSNKNDEMLSYIAKAALLKPDDPHFLLQKAMILIDMKEYENAHQIYTDVLKKKPHHISALLGDAMALNGLGKRDDAIKIMQEIQKKNPAFINQLMRGRSIEELHKRDPDSMGFHS